jgi:hypothetical protein
MGLNKRLVKRIWVVDDVWYMLKDRKVADLGSSVIG